jgi:MFS family permease
VGDEAERYGGGSLLGVLLAGQFIANVDTAIVNIAIPSIAEDFPASPGQLALVGAGYLVAYAVLLVTGARLGSLLGTRPVFLGGLLVFTLASLACGLAPGIGWLVAARVAQGAGAALMVPQVLSAIQRYFSGTSRVRALGYYAVALSGGAVAGQVLGGLLISANLFGAGWRPIFLLNVPIGALLLIAARRVLPAEVREPGRIDPCGVSLLSTSVLLVILPLALGPEQDWPLWAWLCLAVSVPAIGGFVVVERRVAARGGRPLVDPALPRHVGVRLGLLAHGLTTLTYLALLFVVALYLQQGLGMPIPGWPWSPGWPRSAWPVRCCPGSRRAICAAPPGSVASSWPAATPRSGSTSWPVAGPGRYCSCCWASAGSGWASVRTRSSAP